MTKISRVIYLVEASFCKRDYDRFGIETVRNNGFKVEEWDLTPVLHSDIYAKVSVKEPVNFDGYRLFHTKNEVTEAISALQDETFIVALIFYGFNSYPIFRAISRKGIRYALFTANAIPAINNSSAVQDMLRRLNKGITLKKIVNAIFFWLPFIYLGIRPAALLLAGGKISASRSVYYPVNSDTKIVWGHTLDYDIYLKERENAPITEKSFGVFLDEDICFHRDYLYEKLAPFATPAKYYEPLRNFFETLKAKYGFDVIVAAHPRSKYEELPDYFGGRPVIKDKTVELVKRSSFVIAHSTTSISYAALFRKPIIFVTTDELKASAQGKVIEKIASQFNKKAINVNDNFDVDWAKELLIDEKAYAGYRESYIKRSISDDKPFWQIFSDNIKALS